MTESIRSIQNLVTEVMRRHDPEADDGRVAWWGDKLAVAVSYLATMVKDIWQNQQLIDSRVNDLEGPQTAVWDALKSLEVKMGQQEEATRQLEEAQASQDLLKGLMADGWADFRARLKDLEAHGRQLEALGEKLEALEIWASNRLPSTRPSVPGLVILGPENRIIVHLISHNQVVTLKWDDGVPTVDWPSLSGQDAIRYMGQLLDLVTPQTNDSQAAWAVLRSAQTGKWEAAS